MRHILVIPEMSTCDTRNFDNVAIERRLPDAVKHIAHGPIALWSIIRIQILNKIGTKILANDPAGVGSSRMGSVVSKVRRASEEISYLVAFVLAILKSRGVEVVIRVNSFSIMGQNQQDVLFGNGNLQEIYHQLMRQNVRVVVVVTDQSKYELEQKPAGAILYPLLLPVMVEKVVVLRHRLSVNRIVKTLCEHLPVSWQYAQQLISRECGTVTLWSAIYKYVQPKVVYFDCPHNSFESEVVAAKLHGVKTIEMYHGGITQDEPSYSQRHLDYGGLIHGICDEFLSPSEKQTEFLLAINDKYKMVTTIQYKPGLSLSALESSVITATRKRGSVQKKVLFVTSITDHDVHDVTAYIEKHHQCLLDNFSSIALRLHPEDSKERWQSLLDTYRFIELSQLALSDDIASADALVVVSPTIMLQLKALNIDFVDLSRSAI